MKSGIFSGLVLVLVLSGVSGLAHAHGGASGVVKERMELMKEMKQSVKTLSAMFRGQTDYDADAVASAAKTLEKNSGSELTELFPEGSLHKPSEAKPEIWQEWDRFSALADQLKRFSTALVRASENGPAASGTATGMMGTDSMMGTSGMMGGSSMMGSGGAMNGQAFSEEKMASMPADRVFRMITETCSSCHTRYRIEEE